MYAYNMSVCNTPIFIQYGVYLYHVGSYLFNMVFIYLYHVCSYLFNIMFIYTMCVAIEDAAKAEAARLAAIEKAEADRKGNYGVVRNT